MNYLELAQECKLIGMRPHLDGIYQDALEKFAALVETAARVDEREECAKVCDKLEQQVFNVLQGQACAGCAANIRERGTT